MPGRLPAPALACILSLTALQGCGESRTPAPPVVAGLAPVADPELPARARGLVLLGELGCVACHAQEGVAAPAEVRVGPDLATVGQRVRADHLTRYLADPLGVEPGTLMPDLLRDRADVAGDAAALAAYLRSFDAASPPPAAATTAAAEDAAAAERGKALYHRIGCVACHPPHGADGEELASAGRSLRHVAGKYRLHELREFLAAPHLARPARRMPDLHLSPSEAFDLGCFLLATNTAVAPAAERDATVDPSQVRAGRDLFASRGCASCHALPDPARPASPPAKPLRSLDPGRGCLSGAVGTFPFYALTAGQRADLRAALAALDAPLDDEARIRQRLVARNCTACHARGALGGVDAARAQFFGGDDPGIGPEGRLPPPLTGVGAKLQTEWLADAIAVGQGERPYLHVRMPGFGRACGDELAELLARTDTLPAIEVQPLPRDEKERRAVLDLGRALVGTDGMSCISCHRFAGEASGAMAAIDLVHSTGQRLRPEWFALYLRSPFRFKPGTTMPQFFPDGVSVRPQLGGGDVARQIDAMWHYLAEGRNVRKPNGLRPPPIELTVGEHAVLLRRSVQHTGKRGISVGYPGGVNLTFDAERLALNQIWWGGFLDAAPVWNGQGSGEARIVGRDRVALPAGPGIVALADADAPWPEASRRDLGQRWLGYDLDAAERPSFRYAVADVEVTDTALEVANPTDPARPSLLRTLRFAGPSDRTLCMRAAQAAQIEDLGGGEVQVGTSLRLSLGSTAFRIRAEGDTRELRIPIALTEGRAEIRIDYRWTGGGR